MSSKFKAATANDIIKSFKSFSSLLGLFSFKQKPNVNSILLKFHSTITSFILFCALSLLTMNSYFGEPIDCISSKSDIPQQLLVHYCWMEGSFSVVQRTNDFVGSPGYPGVKTETENDRIVYHSYYQWVYYVLIFQSIMFYVPKYVWQRHEASRLTVLIEDLRDYHIGLLLPYDKYLLLQDIADSMHTGSMLLMYFILCDILCVLNLLIQIWLTNLFLGGRFWSLGFEWYKYIVSDYRKHNDPLVKIFPRQVKCTFHKFGYSGTQENIDSLCFLPHNIINEKIYLFLWVWFMFLLVFTFLVLASRALYWIPFYRYFVIKLNSKCYKNFALRQLCDWVGNWFILYNIAKNIKPSYFVHLLDELIDVHFDKYGKQTSSNMFKCQLQSCTKVELKRRKPMVKTKTVTITLNDNNSTVCGTTNDWDTTNDWGTTNDCGTTNDLGTTTSNQEENKCDDYWPMADEVKWGCD